jgi:hypothetical protein
MFTSDPESPTLNGKVERSHRQKSVPVRHLHLQAFLIGISLRCKNVTGNIRQQKQGLQMTRTGLILGFIFVLSLIVTMCNGSL